MSPAEFLEIFERVVDSYSVRIPTYVNVSKKNQKAVNLNIYRNLHHYHLNTQKKNFADEVTPLLRGMPKADQIWIHYTIFSPRNGRLDTMNVGSIADKYFSDTIVESGKIPDDNTDHIVLSTFSFGGLSQMDGHAIATVHILDPIQNKESKDMRLFLDQSDIQIALNIYAKTLQLPNAENAEVELSIEDGEIVAEVILGDAPVKNKGGRPRKVTQQKPAPNDKEEDSDAAEESTDSSDEGSGTESDSGSSDTETSASETGEKTPATTKGKTTTGNLFGDEDGPSSDSTETTNDSETKGSTKVVKPVKKSTIFDA